MVTIYDYDQGEVIKAIAEQLKKVDAIKAPHWASFVKTGTHKERPPLQNDWWYMRTASVLRKVYRLGPIGVSKLRTAYGGKKNRGYKPEHHYKGSGNILRKVLQQLEKAGFIKQESKAVHRGRVMTAAGAKLLETIAEQLSKSQSKA